MTGSSPHVSTIPPAPVFFSLDILAPTRVVRASSAACPSTAVVLVSVDLGAGLSSGVGDAMDGRLLASLVHVFSILSCPYAFVLSTGSLPGGASDASAPDITTLIRQMAVARGQHDTARQELASNRSELCRIQDETTG